MRAAKVQASLRIRAVSLEPLLLAHTSSESRGTFRQKARSLAPLNVWVCAVKVCHDGMLEDTNSLDGAHLKAYKLDLSVAIIRPGRELSLLRVGALTVESLMSNPSISVCGNCSEACRDVGSIDCGCYLLLSFYGLTSQSTAMVMSRRSVTTLFLGKFRPMWLTSTY